MRIACVHVPQFALQSLGRVDSSLRGAPVAVVGAGSEPAQGARPQAALHSPVVQACSRAAWALGVRLGMTAAAARFVSAELRVVAADPQLERETARAIADAVLGVSSLVDLGGRVATAGAGAHLAMYCEVPSKTRGATFGDRLLALLDDFGIVGRIGIADDRFTAWVAAAHGGVERRASARQAGGARGAGASRRGASAGQGEAVAARRAGGGLLVPHAVREHASRQEDGRDGGVSRQASEALRQLVPRADKDDARGEDRGVTSVPRGGSAAFLAPQPLALLAISPEVQHMLEALGVRTLGEFAALPAPSIARPVEFDYQALARGDGGGMLRPYAPEAPIREELVVGGASAADVGLFTGAAELTAIADRLALRLAGRSRVATRLELTITRDGGARGVAETRPVLLDRPTSLASELIEVLAAAIGEGPIARLRVVVAGEAIAGAGGAEVDITEPLVDALSAVLSSAGTAMPLLEPMGHLAPLALPGRSQPWQLSAQEAMRAERRDAHRRTRRAKRRPVSAQPPLFGNGKGEG